MLADAIEKGMGKVGDENQSDTGSGAVKPENVTANEEDENIDVKTESNKRKRDEEVDESSGPAVKKERMGTETS